MPRKKPTKPNREIEALIDEGYREMAEENRRLAEEAFPDTVEALRRVEWNERPPQPDSKSGARKSRLLAGYGAVEPKSKPEDFRKDTKRGRGRDGRGIREVRRCSVLA